MATSNTKKVLSKTNEQLSNIHTVNGMDKLTEKELNRLFKLEIKNANIVSKSIFSKFKALKNDSQTFTNVCSYMQKLNVEFKESTNYLGSLSINDSFTLVANGNAYNYRILGGAISNTFTNYGGKRYDSVLTVEFLKRSKLINEILTNCKKDDANLNQLLTTLFSLFDEKSRKSLGNTGAILLLLNAPKLFLNSELYNIIVSNDATRLKALKTKGKESEFKSVESTVLSENTHFIDFNELIQANEILPIQASETIIEYCERLQEFSSKQATVKVKENKQGKKAPQKLEILETV
jgi:hypothetical protein